MPGFKYQGTIIPCPLCANGQEAQSVVATVDRQGAALRTVICKACGFVFTNPMPTNEELAAFYSDNYRKSYKNAIEPAPRHIYRAFGVAISRVRMMREFLPASGTLLDLGSGGGELVYSLSRLGYRASGVEPNLGYAGFGVSEYGIDVDICDYDSAALKSGGYDAVSSFHVFEHLRDPAKAFGLVHRILKKDGIFFIEVPNIDSPNQTTSNKFHFAHVVHFSPATLAAMAQASGFEVLADLTDEVRGSNVIFVLRRSEDFQSVAPAPQAAAATARLLEQKNTIRRRAVSGLAKKLIRNLDERMRSRHKKGREIGDALIDRYLQ